jgi:hypothetical protein
MYDLLRGVACGTWLLAPFAGQLVQLPQLKKL